jgi:hypothetical protein
MGRTVSQVTHRHGNQIMQCSNATMRLYKPGVVWWRGRGKGGGPEWANKWLSLDLAPFLSAQQTQKRRFLT